MHGAVEGRGAAIGDGVTPVAPVPLAAERLPDAWPGTWNPLGVTVDANGANVAVWSEGAHAVDLCLFDEDGRERRVALSETTFHTFHGYVPGMKAGDRYGFRVHGPWDPWRGDRWNSAKLLMDPYARAIEGQYTPHPATRGHVGHDDTVRDDQDSAPYVPRSVVVGRRRFRLARRRPAQHPLDPDRDLRGPPQGPDDAPPRMYRRSCAGPTRGWPTPR